jgi:CRISPR-associated protein Csx16
MSKIYIVSRHEGAVEWLKSNFKGFEKGELKSHIKPEEIKGNIIVGTLPIHLAELAKEYFHIILNLPAEARGKELTKEDMNEYGAKLQKYKIKAIPNK